jgi:branched-chain amino acid transport system ATP-binding protein
MPGGETGNCFPAGWVASMNTVIETRGLTKKFGDLTAVDKVNYTIREGETSGIIGPNGSGKTTFFNLLSGYFPPTNGNISFNGSDITRMPAHKRVHLGIVRTFQLVSVFSSLTVLENMVLPIVRFKSPCKRGKFMFASALDEGFKGMCTEVLSTVGLSDKAAHPVSSLSYGDKRMLEIGMALSLDPKLLLLDEPLAGLSDHEIQQILALIKRLEDRFTIVIIEHKISKISGLLRRLGVMNEGKIICDGPPDQVLTDEKVRECYWGKEDAC